MAAIAQLVSAPPGCGEVEGSSLALNQFQYVSYGGYSSVGERPAWMRGGRGFELGSEPVPVCFLWRL
jgi:hypothetical protein